MFTIHFLVLGTCKSISQLFKWDATLVPTVKKDWHQAQRHIFHQDQKEEEGLGKRRRSKTFSLFVIGPHLCQTSCMGGWLGARKCNPSRRFLYGNDPDEDEAAGEDVDEGDQLGEEAVLHVARPLKVPFEDRHKDKMDCKNGRYL